MKHLYAIFVLIPLVVIDYQLRAAGLRPDRMHWADKKLLEFGFLWAYRFL